MFQLSLLRDDKTEGQLQWGWGKKQHWALRPLKPLRLIRDEEVGGSGIFLYLTPTRYTVTTRMILHQGGQLYEPF